MTRTAIFFSCGFEKFSPKIKAGGVTPSGPFRKVRKEKCCNEQKT
jgi:hypothetical protein